MGLWHFQNHNNQVVNFQNITQLMVKKYEALKNDEIS